MRKRPTICDDQTVCVGNGHPTVLLISISFFPGKFWPVIGQYVMKLPSNFVTTGIVKLDFF